VAHLLSNLTEAATPPPEIAPSRPGRMEQLEADLSSLREELAELRSAFERFRAQF
jgi:hypothetical protein